MAIYSISDIHVKHDGINYPFLLQFCSLEFQKNDIVIFLGDIFDLVIGDHVEYYKLYEVFFQRCEELISNGVTIHFSEGNHDFHLEKLLERKNIIVHKKPFILQEGGKDFLFCHGDEIELGNVGYKIYKACIRNPLLNIVANYIMPYSLLNFIGNYLSRKSRERNKNRYGSPQDNLGIRDSFRLAAKLAGKKYKTTNVIAGHSHFKDLFIDDKLSYGNNGYVPVTKSFIKISEGKIELQTLS